MNAIKKKGASITPVITLHGIDLHEIIRKYNEGYYEIDRIDKNPIKVKAVIPSLSENISHNAGDGVYIEKYRDVPPIIYATTNHQTCSNFKKCEENNVPKRCDTCKNDIIGTPVGYPVHYERCETEDIENGKKIFRVRHCFWVDRAFCNYQEAMHFLVRIRNSSEWNEEYERLLRILYRLLHNGEELSSNINDPFLLKKNGGSINDKEYHAYNYRKMPGVTLIPVYNEYFKM